MKNVSKEKAFYFFTSIGNYTGVNVTALEEFLEKVKIVENKSLEFHLYRGDFEKWVREVWELEGLAGKIGELRGLNLKGEALRDQFYVIVSDFLDMLETKASSVRGKVRDAGDRASLLVTYDRIDRFAARQEVREVLKEVGEENPRFLYSRVRGLFKIRISMDPKEAIKKLDALCREEPSRFWYTYHWVPVEKWCSSNIDEMSVIVKEFADRIMPEERWRIRINKRLYREYHTQELIERLAENVDRPKVDLENPDKTINIEILGDEAAVSLLGPREHFSVNAVKNEILRNFNMN